MSAEKKLVFAIRAYEKLLPNSPLYNLTKCEVIGETVFIRNSDDDLLAIYKYRKIILVDLEETRWLLMNSIDNVRFKTFETHIPSEIEIQSRVEIKEPILNVMEILPKNHILFQLSSAVDIFDDWGQFMEGVLVDQLINLEAEDFIKIITEKYIAILEAESRKYLM